MRMSRKRWPRVSDLAGRCDVHQFVRQVIAATLLTLLTSDPALAGASRPWTDVGLPPARRAALLQKAMTLQDELGLVHGSIPALMTSRPADVPLSAGWFAAIPRLGVPALRESDASLGVANARRGDRDDAVALPLRARARGELRSRGRPCGRAR